MKQLAFLTGQREHGNEGEDDDRHREEHGTSDESRRRLHGACHRGAIPRVDGVLLDIPERILGDDNRGIDEHADGDGDPRQAHDVRGDPGVIHRQERHQHRERQRQRDDENRSDVQQKECLHERDEDDFLEQRAPKRVGRLRDQRGAVVEGNNLHARRQASRDLIDTRLDGIDDLLCVRAAAHDDDAADGFVAAFDERRHAERIADVDGAELTHVDRHTPRRGDDDVLEIRDRLHQADAPHDGPRAVGFEHVAADVLVAVADGFDHAAEREVVVAEANRIDVDLILLHVAADGGDFGDARHRVQLIADEPVLQRAQVAKGKPIAVNGVPEHVANACRVGPEYRHRAFRHLAAEQAQTLEHAAAREILIDLVLEDDVDHREAERRLRSDDAHAGEPAQVDGERIADLVFDLLRAVAGPVGEDNDLVVGEIGNGVDRRRRRGPPAPDGERHRQPDDSGAVLQRQFDNAVHHEGGGVSIFSEFGVS